MKTIVSHFFELQMKQTEGKKKEITIPKDQLLPYPLVGVYSIKAKPTINYGISSSRHSSGVCSSMWLSIVGPGDDQTVL